MKSKLNDAELRYLDIRTNLKPELMIAHALKNNFVPDSATAYEAFNGLMQLLCCHAEARHVDVPFLIPEGHIYGMYLALRNYETASPSFFFDTFCRKMFQVQHHYCAPQQAQNARIDVGAGVIYTIGQLEAAFPEGLTPLLTEFARKYRYQVPQACAFFWKKAWQYEKFEPAPHALCLLSSRWTRFVD